MVAQPLATDRLFDLYKIALDEYRFQVKLNWDRTTYHLTLSSGLIAIAAGLLKLESTSSLNLAVAAVFFIGFCVSAIGLLTILKGHKYYRNTIVKKTILEDQLGLTRPVEGYETIQTLAVGTTVGQSEHLQILHGTTSWLRRPHRPTSITWWISVILLLFCLADAVGVAGAIYFYVRPLAMPRPTEFRKSPRAHLLPCRDLQRSPYHSVLTSKDVFVLDS